MFWYKKLRKNGKKHHVILHTFLAGPARPSLFLYWKEQEHVCSGLFPCLGKTGRIVGSNCCFLALACLEFIEHQCQTFFPRKKIYAVSVLSISRIKLLGDFATKVSSLNSFKSEIVI